MEITFRFTGALRTSAGISSLTLSLEDGATLRDALFALCDRVPASFLEQVVKPVIEIKGDPPLALLLVNRTHLSGAAELDRPVADGDIVAFVMPMEGG
ncbi:MoaD/ThiS family protein [Chloroflexota bacterium]